MNKDIPSMNVVSKFFLMLLLIVSNVAHADKVTYVYTDPQGTPIAEADEQGNITKTFDYRPYGEQALGQPPNGVGYTGHVNDPDTGLVYMQARYYDPELGRFLSVDPVGPKPGDVFGFNRFAYARNNPIANIDPNGQESASLTLQGVAALQADTAQMTPAQARQAVMAMSLIPGISAVSGIAQAVHEPSAANIAVAAIGVAVPDGGGLTADAVEGISAGERAGVIAGTMSTRTQRSVTIAVTETKEGVRVVSSSEGALRPAARAALADGEVAAKGSAGTHAEANGIKAAKDMGLTPTGTAASRPICSSCAQHLQDQGVKPLSPLKQ
jgi:RHS repeat-associated protein